MRRGGRLARDAVLVGALLALVWLVVTRPWVSTEQRAGAGAAKLAVSPSGRPTAPETLAAEAPGPPPTPSAPQTPSTPPTPQIPPDGPGTFVVAPGQSAAVGAGNLTTYTVEVETGLPYGPADVAAVVDATLADPRGWTAGGEYAFQRVAADGEVRVLLSTPTTTDELCAPLRTRGEVSCRNGERVVINAKRWALAVPHYNGDLTAYRQYAINHEMGHALGYSHVECPRPGALAPTMLQQTYGLDGCLPNPWPNP